MAVCSPLVLIGNTWAIGTFCGDRLLAWDQLTAWLVAQIWDTARHVGATIVGFAHCGGIPYLSLAHNPF